MGEGVTAWTTAVVEVWRRGGEGGGLVQLGRESWRKWQCNAVKAYSRRVNTLS